MPSERRPSRPDSHQLEEESVRFFESRIPTHWVCRRSEGPDYGADLRVEVFEEGKATSLELLVQLKSSARSSRGDSETVRLKVSTYNYLNDKLQVVLLAKFVQEAREMYWLLLADVPEPRRDQESLVIRLPKSNTLTEHAWKAILDHVRHVTWMKLDANRRSR